MELAIALIVGIVIGIPIGFSLAIIVLVRSVQAIRPVYDDNELAVNAVDERMQGFYQDIYLN